MRGHTICGKYYLILLQVERAGRPFLLIMCRKLTAFLGLHIAYYNSAQRTPFLPSSSGALLSASDAPLLSSQP